MYVFIGRKPASTRNEVLGIAVDISQTYSKRRRHAQHGRSREGVCFYRAKAREHEERSARHFIKVKENADGRKIITYSGRST